MSGDPNIIIRNTFSSECDCFHYLLCKRYTHFGKYLCYNAVKICSRMPQIAQFFGEACHKLPSNAQLRLLIQYIIMIETSCC